MYLLDSETSPPLPLIRLIVKYNDDRQQFNPIRLGQQFTGKVANPNDIVLLKTSKIRVKQSKGSLNMEPDENVSIVCWDIIFTAKITIYRIRHRAPTWG